MSLAARNVAFRSFPVIRKSGCCALAAASAYAMEPDDEIWSFRYCPRAPLRPYNTHAASNGPIRRDATRHKVLLSDGFHEAPAVKSKRSRITLSSLGLQISDFTVSKYLRVTFHSRERNFFSQTEDAIRQLVSSMNYLAVEAIGYSDVYSRSSRKRGDDSASQIIHITSVSTL